MRIFINHVNTYSGVALARTLRHMGNVLNRLFGTARGLEEENSSPSEKENNENSVPVPSCIRRLISKRNPQQLLQNLLSCSLAVFDLHNSDPEELEFIFKRLKTEKNIERPLTVVLISSLVAWGNTRRVYVHDPPQNTETNDLDLENEENSGSSGGRQRSSSISQKEDDGSQKDPEESSNSLLGFPEAGETFGENTNSGNDLKPRIISGDNFEIRVPPRSYEKWKMLETLLMSLNSKENFRGFVVSTGLLYGYGEDVLYEAFKASWLGLQTHKVVGGGSNFLPTVHIQDVCTLVKSLALDASKTLGVYHLAVDGAFVTQREVMNAIVTELGTPFEIPSISAEEAALLTSADLLSLDFRFESSPVMTDKSFEWHAKDGFVKSIKQVAAEFCQWRGLRQLKILVTGPPGSGKTSISERLADYFNICHVKPAEVVEHYRKGEVGFSGSAGPLEDSKKKAKRMQLKKNCLDPENLARVLHAKLSQNVCRFRGFVLDGCPKSYEECRALFLKPKRIISSETAEEDEKEAEGKNTENPQIENNEHELDLAFSPDFVIELRAANETCEKRLMGLNPANVIQGHNDREGFKRRMQIYTQQNEAVDGHPKLTDFFQERHVEVLTLTTDETSLDNLFASVIIYLSRFGPIKNFLVESTEWLREQEEALLAREQAEAQQQQERELSERQEEEQQLLKQRERDLARLRRIAEHEQQVLLVRSLPLRRYLMQNVIPTLSEGLLEICRVLPEDPVSYLAAFLFAKAKQL